MSEYVIKMELTNEIRAIRGIVLEGESVLLQFISETVVLQLPTLHPHVHPWFSVGLLLIIIGRSFLGNSTPKSMFSFAYYY